MRLQRYKGTRRTNPQIRRGTGIVPMKARILNAATRVALTALLSFSTLATHADDLDRQMIEYRGKLAAYNDARAAYDELAGPYWASIAEKRKRRIAKQRNGDRPAATDYVLDQPPLYSGPPKPANPENPRAEPQVL